MITGKMKRKCVIYILGMLIMVVSITGCSGTLNSQPGPSGLPTSPVSSGLSPTVVAAAAPAQNTPSPDEVRAKVVEAIGNIATYSFAMTLDTNLSGQSVKSISQLSEIKGSMDKVNKKMLLSMTLTQQTEDSQSKGAQSTAEIYVEGDDMWVKSSGLGTSPQGWHEQAASAGLWQEQDIISQQEKLLKTSEIRLSGIEKVRDSDCYLLEISPDIESIWETIKQQIGAGQLPQGVDPQKMFQEVSMKTWIARDTFLPLRVQEAMTLTINSRDLGVQAPAGTSSVTMKINLDLTASDYNQPISIERPDRLKN
jgi:hypothetical protein